MLLLNIRVVLGRLSRAMHPCSKFWLCTGGRAHLRSARLGIGDTRILVISLFVSTFWLAQAHDCLTKPDLLFPQGCYSCSSRRHFQDPTGAATRHANAGPTSTKRHRRLAPACSNLQCYRIDVRDQRRFISRGISGRCTCWMPIPPTSSHV